MELYRSFDGSRPMTDEFGSAAMTCVVTKSANSANDEVTVKVPNSERPDATLEVNWRVGVKFVDGVAEPRYPKRNDKGIIIETETGEHWLIW